jgi:hypothetical protein
MMSGCKVGTIFGFDKEAALQWIKEKSGSKEQARAKT